MALAGFIVGVAALILALVALLGERVKRPRLEIEAADWEGRGAFPWEFLAVRVSNRPTPGWIGWLFARDSAAGCQVSLTFIAGGAATPAIDQIAARWSAAPEPLNWNVQPPTPDPSKVPLSYRLDVPVDASGEEIAVACSRDGKVFAFSAESYLYSGWQHPEWELAPGRWRVVVRARSADSEGMRSLALEVSDSGTVRWVPDGAE